jgi:hypothetical protein
VGDGEGEMDAKCHIHTLKSIIYSGFAGCYKVPHIEFTDVARDAASVQPFFSQKKGKHDAGWEMF